MKHLIPLLKKILIALCIGVIAGQITGETEKVDYYFDYKEQHEITRNTYRDYRNYDYIEMKKVFNQELADLVTNITTASLLLILLLRSILKEKKAAKIQPSNS